MEVRTLEHKDIEKSVAPEEVVSVNFIEAIINKDNETGKYGGRVLTRFHLNQMVICILAMLNLSALTLVLASNTMA